MLDVADGEYLSVVGRASSIGICFWATDSSINNDPRFANPFGYGDSTNGSFVEPLDTIDTS